MDENEKTEVVTTDTEDIDQLSDMREEKQQIEKSIGVSDRVSKLPKNVFKDDTAQTNAEPVSKKNSMNDDILRNTSKTVEFIMIEDSKPAAAAKETLIVGKTETMCTESIATPINENESSSDDMEILIERNEHKNDNNNTIDDDKILANINSKNIETIEIDLQNEKNDSTVADSNKLLAIQLKSNKIIINEEQNNATIIVGGVEESSSGSGNCDRSHILEENVKGDDDDTLNDATSSDSIVGCNSNNKTDSIITSTKTATELYKCEIDINKVPHSENDSTNENNENEIETNKTSSAETTKTENNVQLDKQNENEINGINNVNRESEQSNNKIEKIINCESNTININIKESVGNDNGASIKIDFIEQQINNKSTEIKNKNGDDVEIVDDKSKCAYDDETKKNEIGNCLSPDVCPVGFKDKFKKSLEIIEKSRLESSFYSNNSGEKFCSKITEEQQMAAMPTSNVQIIEKVKKSNNVIAKETISMKSSTSLSSSPTQHLNEQFFLDTCERLGNTTSKPEHKQKIGHQQRLLNDCEANELKVNNKLEFGDVFDTKNDKFKTNNLLPNQINSNNPSLSYQHSTNNMIEASKDYHSKHSEQISETTITTRTIIVSPKHEPRTQFNCANAALTNLEPIQNPSVPTMINKNDLYVSKPDFLKSLRPTVRDLSELKMKPPDFSRISRSSELHVPNPDFTKAYDDLVDTSRLSPNPPPRDVNASNFAEISKKYNYISDLQLKIPVSVQSSTVPPPAPRSSCSPLYVKIPDFTNSKLRNEIESSSVRQPLDGSTPHIISNIKLLGVEVDSSSKRTDLHLSNSSFQEQIGSGRHANFSIAQHHQPLLQKAQTTKLESSNLQNNLIQNCNSESTKTGTASSPKPYAPMPSERQKYEKKLDKVKLINVQTSFSDKLYARNSNDSSMVPQQYHIEPMETATHSIRTKKNNSNVPPPHSYEHYSCMSEKMVTHRLNTDINVSGHHHQLNDHSTHNRQHPSTINPSLYYEKQSRQIKNNQSAPEMSLLININSNSSPQHPILTSSSSSPSSPSSKTLSQTNKQTEYYNQLKSSNKWSTQQRITQSPISTASSPLSISSQSTRISQSPVSVSPLPYHVHRQSPSNVYASPHITPSSSPYGYPPSPNYQMTVKSHKLPTNAPPNTINLTHNIYPPINSPTRINYRPQSTPIIPPPLSMEKTDCVQLPMPTTPAYSKNQSSVQLNKVVDPKTKYAPNESNRDYDQQQQQQISSYYRPGIATSRFSTKTESTQPKCTERADYKQHMNTIVDPYVYRQSSEADLNYQIIKKTLNKEIPTPSFNRQHADMNISAISSRAHNHTLPSQQQQAPIIDEKNHLVQKDKNSSSELEKLMYLSKPMSESEQNKTQYPLHMSYASHQIPIPKQSSMSQNDFLDYKPTKSNIVRPIVLSSYQNQHLPSTSQQQASPLAAASLQMQKTNFYSDQNPSSMPVYSQQSQQQVFDTNNPSRSVGTSIAKKVVNQSNTISRKPVNDVSSSKTYTTVASNTKKGESPLDLSVKTVKTKADSTGVYDYSLPSRRHNIPTSLKVDFAPNFSKSPQSRNDNNNRNLGRRIDENDSTSSSVPMPSVVKNPMSNSYNNQSHTSSHQLINESSSSVPPQFEYQQQHNYAARPKNISADRCKTYEDCMTHSSGKSSTKSSQKSIAKDVKSRNESKVPMIFGQQPEQLKNFTPDYVLHNPNDPNTRKKGLPISTTNNSTEKSNKECPSNSMHHPYPMNNSSATHPQRINSQQPSEIIQYAFHSHHQMPTTPALANHPHDILSHTAVSNRLIVDKQSNNETVSHNQHVSMQLHSRKRFAKNEDYAPMPFKQGKYEPTPNGNHVTNMNRQSMFPETLIKSTEAIGMPVIVPPVRAKVNEPQYYYDPTISLNKHSTNSSSAFDLGDIKNDPSPYHPHLSHNFSAINETKIHLTPEIPSPMSSTSVDQQPPPHQSDSNIPVRMYKSIYSQSYSRDGNSSVTQNIQSSSTNTKYASFTSLSDPYKLSGNYKATTIVSGEPTTTVSNSDSPNIQNNTPTTNNNCNNSVADDNNNNNMDSQSVNTASNTNSTYSTKRIERSVILKLRNNLEIKEIEKHKALRNDGVDKSAEEPNKSDIASILAARIRTKAELKGFTVPVKEQPKENAVSVVDFDEIEQSIPNSIESISKDNSCTGFDLMDWGTTCNDFLEQLKNRTSNICKKKQSAKVLKKVKLDEFSGDNKQTTILKNSQEENSDKKCLSSTLKTNEESDVTSSDEDKPLLLLRQQSLNEKNSKSNSTNEVDVDSVGSGASSQKTKNDLLFSKLSLDKRTKNSSDCKHTSKQKDKIHRKAVIESSSDIDEEPERTPKRKRKLVRKPRTRSSFSNSKGNNVGNEGDSDESDNPLNNNGNTLNKKRNLKIKSTSESDVDANRNSKMKKSLELNSDTDDINTSSSSGKESPPSKVEETMTRSKRKRELEIEIANSKVLRNDKMIKYNIVMPERKNSRSSTHEKKQNNNIKHEQNGTNQRESVRNVNLNKIKHRRTLKSKNETTKSVNVLTNKSTESKNESSSSEEESTSSSDDQTIITDRLRSRTSKLNNIASKLEQCSKSDRNQVGSTSFQTCKKQCKFTPKKSTAELGDMSEESRSQFPPGWEEQAYEYKRSLKIPPRLISIGRPSNPPWHRKSTSLPDLDPHHSSDASETFLEVNKKYPINNSVQVERPKSINKKDDKCSNENSLPGANDNNILAEEPSNSKSKSIIDLLHQRVIRPTGRNKKLSRQGNTTSEPKILPQSNEVELLPTPGEKGDTVFKPDNLFETAVLKSRTRKEYKAIKTQEIIREVFGGEDRPASAPPYNFEIVKQQQQLLANVQPSSPKAITFDQQYEQYLEKMNIDYGEKIRKVKNNAKSNSTADSSSMVKIEKVDEDSLLNQEEDSQDTEFNECIKNDIKEEMCDDSTATGPNFNIERNLDTPTPLQSKKIRANRHSRRKGSSGIKILNHLFFMY